jgi:DnaK suppressor protein
VHVQYTSDIVANTALTPAQLDDLRAEISSELKRLERSIRVSAESAAPVTLDQSAVGRVSRADAMQNQQMSANTRGRSQARHAELVEALARLDAGTFGACQRCGADMPMGRLMVFPEARFCATCGARG